MKPKMQTIIENDENQPFLLPIDISKYGKFEPDEIEIRVTNDFVEVSGKQDWRMCSGGADQQSFRKRHVIPKYIDLNAVLCRLMDDSVTVLITAPSISLVSKLTNLNQPTVDYALGLDRKGFQFLKRYNTKNSNSNLKQIAKSLHDENRLSKEEKANEWLFDLVNHSKSTNDSKLFATTMRQKNIDFVNNLKNSKSKAKQKDNKIRLNIDELMKEKKNEDELNASAKKKKSRLRKKKSESSKKNDSSLSDEKKFDEKKIDEKKDSSKDTSKDQKKDESTKNKKDAKLAGKLTTSDESIKSQTPSKDKSSSKSFRSLISNLLNSSSNLATSNPIASSNETINETRSVSSALKKDRTDKEPKKEKHVVIAD